MSEITLAEIPESLPSLNAFAEECLANEVAHGFEATTTENLPDKLMLAVGELSEAAEEYRAGRPLTDIYVVVGGNELHAASFPGGAESATYKSLKPEGFPVEIADVAVRILGIIAARKVDLDYHVRDYLWELRRPFEDRQETLDEGQPDPGRYCSESGDFLQGVDLARARLERGSPLRWCLEIAATICRAQDGADMPVEDFGWEADCGWKVDDDMRIGPCLGMAVAQMFLLAQQVGFDLLAAMKVKHAYNLTRPFKHGKIA